MISSSFKNVTYKMCLQIIYLIFMFKEDLAFNNLHWLIYHKTQQTLSFFFLSFFSFFFFLSFFNFSSSLFFLSSYFISFSFFFHSFILVASFHPFIFFSLFLSIFFVLSISFWGCRIHRLQLCRGVKLP